MMKKITNKKSYLVLAPHVTSVLLLFWATNFYPLLLYQNSINQIIIVKFLVVFRDHPVVISVIFSGYIGMGYYIFSKIIDICRPGHLKVFRKWVISFWASNRLVPYIRKTTRKHFNVKQVSIIFFKKKLPKSISFLNFSS